MTLPVTITGISTAVAPVGPFKSTNASFIQPSVNNAGYQGWSDASARLRIAQSFTTVGAISVNGISAMVGKTGAPTDDLACGIFETDGSGLPIGLSIGTSNAISGSALLVGPSIKLFDFPSPVLLSASTKYAVVFFRSSGIPDASNYYRLYGDLTGTYSGGCGILLDGATWTNQTSDFCVSPYGDTAYYFFGRDGSTAGTLQAYKATDPTSSWASVTTKTGFQAINYIAGYQVSDLIHLLISDGVDGATKGLKYLTFDMTADGFSATPETILSNYTTAGQTGATQQACSLVVRGNGNVVAFYNSAQSKTSGTWRARVSCNERASGAWDTNPFPQRVDANTGVDNISPLAVLDHSNDAVYFAWCDSPGISMKVRTLSAANALQTAQSGATNNSTPTQGVSFDNAGTTKVVITSHVGGAGTGAGSVIFDGGNTPTVVSKNLPAGALWTSRIFNDGTTVYVAFLKSDNDLYIGKSTDYGATYDAGTSVFVGTITTGSDTVLSCDGNIYQRSDFVIPYVVNDNGTIRYNESVVRSAIVFEASNLTNTAPSLGAPDSPDWEVIASSSEGGYSGGFGDNTTLAYGQTFTATSSCEVVSITVRLMKEGPVSSNVYAEIRSADFSELIATSTNQFASSDIGITLSDKIFAFDAVSLDAGNYSFVLQVSSQASAGIYYRAEYGITSGYASGKFWYLQGTTWSFLDDRDLKFSILAEITGPAAAPLINSSPTLDAPAIAQKQVVAAAILTNTAPVLGPVTFAQKQILVASNLENTAPGLVGVALGVRHSLVASELVNGAAVLNTPAFAQKHAFTAALTNTSPVLASATLGQKHVLIANGLTASAPVLDTPALSLTQPLESQSYLNGSPYLTAIPAFAKTGHWTAASLTNTAPAFDTVAIGQKHVLTANSLTNTAPVLGAPATGGTASLEAASLTNSSPVLDAPVLVRILDIPFASFTNTAPNFGTENFLQQHALASSALSTGPPLLAATSIAQKHALTAANFINAAPVIPGISITGEIDLVSLGLTTTPLIPSVAFTSIHAFTVPAFFNTTPALNAPALGKVLTAANLTNTSPVLSAPTLTVVVSAAALTNTTPSFGAPLLRKVLAAAALTNTAPVLGPATIGQKHVLTASPLTNLSPQLPAFFLAIGAIPLAINDLYPLGPVLGAPAVAQKHALAASALQNSAWSYSTVSYQGFANFTAAAITTTPLLGAPAFQGVSGLAAAGLTAGLPVFGTVTFRQSHSFTAASLANSAWSYSITLHQKHSLTAAGLQNSAPLLPAPTITQEHHLSTNGLTAGVVLGAPAIGQNHVLSASPLSVGVLIGAAPFSQTGQIAVVPPELPGPLLGNPSIGQRHVLVPSSLANSAPALGPATLAENQKLYFANLVNSAPALGHPAIGQCHTLQATGLTNNAPSISPVVFGFVGQMTIFPLENTAPVFGSPGFTQNHKLRGGLVNSAPLFGAPSIGQKQVLRPASLTITKPLLSAPLLRQKQVLQAYALLNTGPTLAVPKLLVYKGHRPKSHTHLTGGSSTVVTLTGRASRKVTLAGRKSLDRTTLEGRSA